MNSREVFKTIFSACYLTSQHINVVGVRGHNLTDNDELPFAESSFTDWFDRIVSTDHYFFARNINEVYQWVFARLAYNIGEFGRTFAKTITHIIYHGHVGILPGAISLINHDTIARLHSFNANWENRHGVFTFHYYHNGINPPAHWPYAGLTHPYDLPQNGKHDQVIQEHKKKMTDMLIRMLGMNNDARLYGTIGLPQPHNPPIVNLHAWNWDSLSTANVDGIRTDNCLAVNDIIYDSEVWLSGKRCLAEILTGLTSLNVIGGGAQVIQHRGPPIKIRNANDSINIVIPIQQDIGSGMDGMVNGAFPAGNHVTRYIEMYLKVKNGKISIETVFPTNDDEYNGVLLSNGNLYNGGPIIAGMLRVQEIQIPL